MADLSTLPARKRTHRVCSGDLRFDARARVDVVSGRGVSLVPRPQLQTLRRFDARLSRVRVRVGRGRGGGVGRGRRVRLARVRRAAPSSTRLVGRLDRGDATRAMGASRSRRGTSERGGAPPDGLGDLRPRGGDGARSLRDLRHDAVGDRVGEPPAARLPRGTRARVLRSIPERRAPGPRRRERGIGRWFSGRHVRSNAECRRAHAEGSAGRKRRDPRAVRNSQPAQGRVCRRIAAVSRYDRAAAAPRAGRAAIRSGFHAARRDRQRERGAAVVARTGSARQAPDVRQRRPLAHRCRRVGRSRRGARRIAARQPGEPRAHSRCAGIPAGNADRHPVADAAGAPRAIAGRRTGDRRQRRPL